MQNTTNLKKAYTSLYAYLIAGVKAGVITNDPTDMNGEIPNSYQWFSASLRRHMKLSEKEQIAHIAKLFKYMERHNLIVELKEAD